ncbi:MAG: PorV/PorQ family protein [Candidatus Firestonebacteria bacterium]
MKKIIVLMMVVFVSISYASGPGSTGANYLRIGMGARAAGMGEAQVAIADNVDSIYWNPAGLCLIKSSEIGLMHLSYWQGINYEYLAYALPVKNIGTFGVGVTYLNSGSIDKTTENITGSDYTSAGTFNYIAFSGVISYGHKFVIEKVPINLGANLKIIGDKIEDDTVLGAGLDLGATSEVMKNLTVGATANNIGVLFGENVSLPLTFKVGAGYKLELFEKKHNVTVALDGVLPIDSKIKVDTGLEYNYDNMIFVRGGYKINYDLESFTVGAGFRLTMSGTQYELNYAFAPAKEDVGQTHRISLIVRFSLPSAENIE